MVLKMATTTPISAQMAKTMPKVIFCDPPTSKMREFIDSQIPNWLMPKYSSTTAINQATRPTSDMAKPTRNADSGVIRFSETFRRRSEEHTSELQSRGHLVCRLLLGKKKRE